MRELGRGGYHASQLGRRLRGWEAERRTINALLATGGEELIARSRHLCRENPFASSAKEAFVGAGVGSGLKPSSQHPDAVKKKAIADAFLRWTDEADADGLTDFYGLQALAAGAMFEAGEVFVRFRPRLPKDGLSVPLQLQLYESEMLSYRKNETAPNGNIIREGIEFDALGRRVAYHFFKSHPGELYPVIFDFSYNRVPASEVLHLFRPLRPGQIRGQPQLTPAMVRLYLLDIYDDAELARKQVATLFAGFVSKKSPKSDNPLLRQPGEDDGSGEPVPADTAIVPMEPGQIQVLNDDETITFSSPSEVGGSYEAFQWRNLLAIAAGCGVPYADVTTDTSQSNYSSDRADTVKFRRRMDQFQHMTLVFQLCRPVWDRWFQLAVLAGAIPVTPRELVAEPHVVAKVKWIPPAWPWVDPWKDRKAMQIAVQEGWTARSDVIEMEGEEPEDTDARIQADRKREIDMDLGFRPVAIKENVNIAATADDPDAAVKAATTGGDEPGEDLDDTDDGDSGKGDKPAPAKRSSVPRSGAVRSAATRSGPVMARALRALAAAIGRD